MSVPCAYCDDESIETCSACGRPVCDQHLVVAVAPADAAAVADRNEADRARAALFIHRHSESVEILGSALAEYRAAFANGPARCEACRRRDGNEAELARVRRAQTRLTKASTALETLEQEDLDPSALARALVDVASTEVWTSELQDLLLAGWKRLAAMLTPSHEVVEVHVTSGLLRRQTETARVPVYWVGQSWAIAADGRMWEVPLRASTEDVGVDEAGWYLVDEMGGTPTLRRSRGGTSPVIEGARRVSPVEQVDRIEIALTCHSMLAHGVRGS